MDATSYARCLGYTGRKRVIVCDGKVTSHRRACWFAWCERIERKAKSRQT